MIGSLKEAALIFLALICLAMVLVILILCPVAYVIGALILCVFYYPYIQIKRWLKDRK